MKGIVEQLLVPPNFPDHILHPPIPQMVPINMVFGILKGKLN
jgi:hypothetical protein